MTAPRRFGTHERAGLHRWGQVRAIVCGWCGAELCVGGPEDPPPARLGDFFCPACQENNAPCCQCGSRDCYLLTSGECPSCAEKRADLNEPPYDPTPDMGPDEAERIAAREQAIFDAGSEHGYRAAKDEEL